MFCHLLSFGYVSPLQLDDNPLAEREAYLSLFVSLPCRPVRWIVDKQEIIIDYDLEFAQWKLSKVRMRR